MTLNIATLITCTAVCLVAGAFMLSQSNAIAQGKTLQADPVDISLKASADLR
ncbi:hypothetical protein [Oceanicola sp. D3]|uniref:hypothetical protein n=1 Tax=Oceanicola sp. D3 TaxID=2587163 RepID=UPI00143D7B05|nr:hypothetical protein [Oceanicola sp. D3]